MTVDEAVQHVGRCKRCARVLVLHPREESRVRTEAERSGDARARAIRPNQESSRAEAVHLEAALQPPCAGERALVCDGRARAFGFAGEPAHHGRRIGRKEVIARRFEIDVTQIRRIQAHTRDAAHQGDRQRVEQRDLIDRVLDDDSGGVEPGPRIVLLLDNGYPQPGAGERKSAREAGEAGPDHHAIGFTLRALQTFQWRPFPRRPAATKTAGESMTADTGCHVTRFRAATHGT